MWNLVGSGLESMLWVSRSCGETRTMSKQKPPLYRQNRADVHRHRDKREKVVMRLPWFLRVSQRSTSVPQRSLQQAIGSHRRFEGVWEFHFIILFDLLPLSLSHVLPLLTIHTSSGQIHQKLSDLGMTSVWEIQLLSAFPIYPKHSVEFFHLETEMTVNQRGLW